MLALRRKQKRVKLPGTRAFGVSPFLALLLRTLAGERQLKADGDLTSGLELRVHNVHEYRFLGRRLRRGR